MDQKTAGPGEFDYRSSHVMVYTLVNNSVRDRGCVDVAALRKLAAEERMDPILLGWQMARVGLNLVEDQARLFLIEPRQRTLDEKLVRLGAPDTLPGQALFHDMPDMLAARAKAGAA